MFHFGQFGSVFRNDTKTLLLQFSSWWNCSHWILNMLKNKKNSSTTVKEVFTSLRTLPIFCFFFLLNDSLFSSNWSHGHGKHILTTPQYILHSAEYLLVFKSNTRYIDRSPRRLIFEVEKHIQRPLKKTMPIRNISLSNIWGGKKQVSIVSLVVE